MAAAAAASSGAGGDAPHAAEVASWPLGGLAGGVSLRLGRPSRASDLLASVPSMMASLGGTLGVFKALVEAATSADAWASDGASWRTAEPGNDLTYKGVEQIVKALPLLNCPPVLSEVGTGSAQFAQEMMRQVLLVRIENSESIRRTKDAVAIGVECTSTGGRVLLTACDPAPLRQLRTWCFGGKLDEGRDVDISWVAGRRTQKASVEVVEIVPEAAKLTIVGKPSDRNRRAPRIPDGVSVTVSRGHYDTDLPTVLDAFMSLLARPRLMKAIAQTVFPTRPVSPTPVVDADPVPASSEADLDWVNESLNESQKAAVRVILAEPKLHIVQGPPGTGKSTTLCELVHQQLARQPRSQLLVLSHSNVAVDLLTAALLDGSSGRRVAKEKFIRWRSRGRRTVHIVNDLGPEKAKLVHSVTPGTSFPDVPSQYQIDTAQVFAMTLSMAGKLSRLPSPPDFDMIICDEMSQATDADLIPALLGPFRARMALRSDAMPPTLVLAGDPDQLGPVVHSRLARLLGRSISCLERLATEGGIQSQVLPAASKAWARALSWALHRVKDAAITLEDKETFQEFVKSNAGEMLGDEAGGGFGAASEAAGGGPRPPDCGRVLRLRDSYRCHPDIARLWSGLTYTGNVRAARGDLDPEGSARGRIASEAVLAALQGEPFSGRVVEGESKDAIVAGLKHKHKTLGESLRTVLNGRLAGCGAAPRVIVVLADGDECQAKDGTSLSNEPEANIVMGGITAALEAGVSPKDIASVSPYAHQAFLVYEKVQAKHPETATQLRGGTIEKFQGQEVSVEFLSLAVTSGHDVDESHPELTARFASDQKRVNVAISRARDLLVLVGHPDFMESAPNLAAIVAYAAEIGGLVDATEAQEWANGYRFDGDEAEQPAAGIADSGNGAAAEVADSGNGAAAGEAGTERDEDPAAAADAAAAGESSTAE